MRNIYLQNIDAVLECINHPEFDITCNDNQLLRELQCGRLTLSDTLKVYSKLVEKHNYLITTGDLDKLILFCNN